MATAQPPLLQFTPFSSIVQPAFWQELTKLKIDVLKLSQDAVPICATYSLGRAVVDRETGKEVALGCNLVVGGDAFADEKDIRSVRPCRKLMTGWFLIRASLQRPPPHSVVVRGMLKNFNTVEDFKAVDKKELFNSTSKEVSPRFAQVHTPSHHPHLTT